MDLAAYRAQRQASAPVDPPPAQRCADVAVTHCGITGQIVGAKGSLDSVMVAWFLLGKAIKQVVGETP